VGQLFYPFADVTVLSSKNTSDKKSTVHTLSLKEGFFVGCIYKKKGLGLLGAQQKERNNRVHIKTIVLIYRYQFSTVYG